MRRSQARAASVLCVAATVDRASALREPFDGRDEFDVTAASDPPAARRAVRDGVDCVVAGGRFGDGVAVEFLGNLPDRVATVLVADGVADVATEAARAGVGAWFPRDAMGDDPSAVVERVRDLVDIRERRRTAERFRTVADHVEEVIFVTRGIFVPGDGTAAESGSGGPMYMSPAFETVYGRPVEAVYESPAVLYEAVHPDDRTEYRAHLERMVADAERDALRERYEFSFRIRRPDGEVRWLEATMRPASDCDDADGADDAPRRWVGVSRDVTERTDRERALEATERRFERITENVDEVIFNTYGVVSIADEVYEETPSDVGIDYISPAFEDVWGRPVESVYENPRVLYEAVHPEDRATFRESVERMAADAREGDTDDAYVADFRVRRPDGTVRWVSASAYPVPLHDSDRYYWVGVIEDVSEQRRRRRYLEQIAAGIDEVVYLSAPDLSEVFYVSPGYEEIWGRPPAEVYEEPLAFLDGVHPDDQERFRAAVEAVRADLTDPTREHESTYTVEYRVVQPDGTVRWVETVGYPLVDERGDAYRFVAVNRDVTEQKRRERTLESFHEATRRLTEATSPADACETAVTAAEDVLEFPEACVYRYEEPTGDLRPVAASSRVDAVDDLPTAGAGDGHLWQVFVEGEAFRTTDVDDGGTLGDAGTAAAELCLPLGSHGVLVLGAGEGFDTDDIEVAQILAARLEAGLNHVEGERELRAREAELERQTRRAERLDRLTAIVADVERALVEESTRAGIERSVCDRLVAADAYRLAWVGEPAVGSEGVTVRARADESADGVDVVVDGPTVETHPAWRALSAGEVVTVDNLVTGGTHGEWRRTALGRGLQSCCAVPLAHGDRVHGVLVVYADEPNAFEERERRVLAQLGGLIGYGVTTVEHRRALESDHTAELEFALADERLPFVSLAREAGARVEYRRTIRRPDGTVSTYYAVHGAVDVAALDPALSGEVDPVTDGEDATVVEVRDDDWFGSAFADYGAVVNVAVAGEEAATEEERAAAARGRLVVELPQGADTRELVERVESEYDGCLLAKRETDPDGWTPHELRAEIANRLTDRQREVLETAFEAGYFEWPRESSGQEVAEMLDIAQPTFNRHMRRTERVTFSALLE